jgi:type IV secretory pathway VirB9-like protein
MNRRLPGLVLATLLSASGHGMAQVPNVPIPGGRPAIPAPQPASRAPGAAAPVLAGTEAAIDQESRGDFPPMDRTPSLPLGTLQRSWDRPAAASGQAAPGIIHYLWHPDFVMGVRTRDFMVTTLVLPAWERANEFYVGDPVVFETKRVRANVLAVRSRNAGADSNLTVLGASGNVYNFYLRSETWNSTQVTDLTVYLDAPREVDEGLDAAAPPSDPSSSGPGSGMPDYLRRIVFRPEDLRFDMKMFIERDDDAEIAPERVFEDGIFTYFDYGERADSAPRPVIHQLVDGVDTVVNTRTAGSRGTIVIAEAVGDFTLRNGTRVVCVRRVAPAKNDDTAGPRPVARHANGRENRE